MHFRGKLKKVLNISFHEKNIHGRGVTVKSDTFIKLSVLWSEPLSCHYSSCIAVGGPLKSYLFLLTIHAGYARQANCDTYHAHTCSCLWTKMNTHFKPKPWVPYKSI